MLRLLLLLLFIVSCGSEAKFHSVYVNETAPQQRKDKDRRVYVCEYEPTYNSDLENYVCREIPETSCVIDK